MKKDPLACHPERSEGSQAITGSMPQARDPSRRSGGHLEMGLSWWCCKGGKYAAHVSYRDLELALSDYWRADVRAWERLFSAGGDAGGRAGHVWRGERGETGDDCAGGRSGAWR